jgi:hypothetical protein
MPQTADRNLLLGILALQTDFITRDALIAAMNTWALQKHRPLEDILVDQGALDPADRDSLSYPTTPGLWTVTRGGRWAGQRRE